jgi:predicted RNA-binding Zn-ribbon protein involved in translation (DUF1610 family)
MKEINRLNQNRRDFVAMYQCEKCGHKENISGYDDSNFHVNVVPTFKCKACGESTDSLGISPTDNTSVPAHVVM